MSPAFRVVIPARMGSTRLPGKPLRWIAGHPLIGHVCCRAQASRAFEVVVATDDERIAEAVRPYGVTAVLTRPDHASGTDRIAEVCTQLDWPDEGLIVNLQGDEPLMSPSAIDAVARDLDRHPDAAVSTLVVPLEARNELGEPSIVKVVCDESGYALYFSRAPIPWQRSEANAGDAGERPVAWSVGRRHVGLYAYRVGYLRRFTACPPSPLEQVEQLEQLRALSMGQRIHVLEMDALPGPGVDTPEDLVRVEQLLKADC